MIDNIVIACECNSFCEKPIVIGVVEMIEIRNIGCIVISNECEHGPKETDALVKKTENYSVYKEKE